MNKQRSCPLIVAVMTCGLVLGTAASAGTEGYVVYVSNEDSNDLSVIDPGQAKVIATIAVGKRPRGIRASPDGAHIFVALSGSPKCPPTMPDEECEALIADKSADGIAMIDAAQRRVLRVLPGGSDPEQFDISPNQARLFVANEDAGTASIVDIAAGKVIHEVAVGREPEGVKAAPSGDLFLVTGESDHDVSFVDPTDGTVFGRVEVGRRPRDIIFTADGRQAIVSAEASRQVAIVDIASRQVTQTIELPAGALPMGLALSPDGSTLYVANGRGRTISKVDLATSATIASVEVGPRPWGIALAPDGTRLYSANGPSHDVSVIDTRTFTVIARIPVGKSPWGVAVGRTAE